MKRYFYEQETALLIRLINFGRLNMDDGDVFDLGIAQEAVNAYFNEDSDTLEVINKIGELNKFLYEENS